MKRLFPFALLLIAATPAFAADANGYTATYECRAGNSNCDVDTASLGKRACDQTVTSSTPWSSINWSNNTICIEAGDHTSKGTLTIPSSARGSAGNYKVLRYSRSGDTDDEPWNQSGANQAKMPRIEMNGADYWIIHRLTFTGIAAPAIVTPAASGATYNIINRVLFDGLIGTPVSVVGAFTPYSGNSYNWLQNSVCRNFQKQRDLEISCLYNEAADHIYMVNNESYNVTGADWQDQGGGSDSVAGSVVENNDFYITDAYRYNGSGVQTNGGNFMGAKSTVSSKRGGTSAAPVKIIHNRIWGKRQTDINVCCTSTGSGFAFLWSNNDNADSAHTQYQLVQNNIVVDSSGGVNVPRSGPSNNSAIGNIFYRVRNYGSAGRGVLTPYVGNNSEYYLNTIIESDRHLLASGNSNEDFRCNVYINAGDKSGSAGSGTQFDYNVWYGTTPYGTESPGYNLGNFAVKTRQNNTNYSLGDIIRTSSTPETSCTATTDSACFLYKVTTAGTSSSNAPSYTTTPGGSTTDGTMVVSEIRGPYSFYRKLRTSPELYVIPYAKPHALAPETGSCPTNMLGSRAGVGAYSK